jgi:hypothetical protein
VTKTARGRAALQRRVKSERKRASALALITEVSPR